MAEFIQRDVRRVTFDLSKVEIGQSIFSKNGAESMCSLCVKTKEDEWRVFSYDQDNRHLTAFNTCDPNYHIFKLNEIFDENKTKWVQEYFEMVERYLATVTNFEQAIRHNFI